MISKSDFLSAVDLIDRPSSSQDHTVFGDETRALPVLTNGKLEQLPRNGEKSHLWTLVSMLSETGMKAPTDDELLDDEWEGSNQIQDEGEKQKPPPIPPRTKSTPTMNLYSIDDTAKREKSAKYPESSFSASRKLRTLPEELSTPNDTVAQETRVRKVPIETPQSPQLWSPISWTMREKTSSPDRGFLKYRRADSDTDSSDDFVPYIPPKMSRYSVSYVDQKPIFPPQSGRRISTPLPKPPHKGLKKSSPILTKKPCWYMKPDKPSIQRKYQSMPASQLQDIEKQSTPNRRLKCRSRSLGDEEYYAVPPKDSTLLQELAGLRDSQANDNSDVNTSREYMYSKPFEHLLWGRLRLGQGLGLGRKLGLDSSSVLSGSLPCLDAVKAEGDKEEEDSEGCTYLDPTELEEFCEELGNRRLSNRVQKRLSTVLSHTYLSLTSFQPPQDDPAAGKPSQDELCNPITEAITAEQPNASLQARELPMLPERTFSPLDRWKQTFADSCSGYSSDASSGGDLGSNLDSTRLFQRRASNPYAEIKAGQALVQKSEDTGLLVEVEEVPEEEDQIYEEIDDYSDTNMDGNTVAPIHGSQTLPSMGHIKLCPSHSVPVSEGQYSSRSLPRHCNLEEVHTTNRGSLEAPPMLPPRPKSPLRKVASFDPGEGRRREYDVRDHGVSYCN